MIFLIYYDRRDGVIRSLSSFNDADRQEAEAARLAIELEPEQSTDTEVVLLEAESEGDLRKTHRRYFVSASDLLRTAADEATTASQKGIAS